MNAKEARDIASKPYQWVFSKIEEAAKVGRMYCTIKNLMPDEIKHLESLDYKVLEVFGSNNKEYDVSWYHV